MFGTEIGPGEVILVLVIALLVFGPSRLPELGKTLGRGMRDFKRGVTGEDEDERRAEETEQLLAKIPPPGAPVAEPTTTTAEAEPKP